MPSILFVCTANRYRSPIAAACFRRELASRGLEAGWQVSSAGTWTSDGSPAMPEAISRARQLGLDISGHASRVITSRLMKDADLIVVMEQGQKESLAADFPGQADKVHLLSEATSGMTYDVSDPVMSPSDADVPREISDLINAGFDRICALIPKK